MILKEVVLIITEVVEEIIVIAEGKVFSMVVFDLRIWEFTWTGWGEDDKMNMGKSTNKPAKAKIEITWSKTLNLLSMFLKVLLWSTEEILCIYHKLFVNNNYVCKCIQIISKNHYT